VEESSEPAKGRGVQGRKEGQPHGPASTGRSKEPKVGWGKSLFLWGKFSVAIMLAVGGAIVKGPAEMLRDTDVRRRSWEDDSPEARGLQENAPMRHAFAKDEISRRDGRRQQARDCEDKVGHSRVGVERNVRKPRSHSSPILAPRYPPDDVGISDQTLPVKDCHIGRPKAGAAHTGSAHDGRHAVAEETPRAGRSEGMELDPMLATQSDEYSATANQGSAEDDSDDPTVNNSSDYG
jgi:hypothetical protein